METLDSLRAAAKAHVHENLVRRIDLRRVKYEELEGDVLRARVQEIVRSELGQYSATAGLERDETLISDIVDEAVGLGPLEALLRDPSVTEVMVNGPRSVWAERDGKIERTPLTFVHEASLRTIIDRIVTPLGRRVDESSPMVDARLKDGSRVNVILPPLALGGPTITIRKFSRTPISVRRLVRMGSITEQAATFLKTVVQLKKNILIAGGTGSGKTTLLNALSSFIPPDDRIVTIEDAAELRLIQPHVVSLEARPSNIEGKGEITIRDLVRNALRMRPDRIIVGECRSGEALDMLQAMNTGHDGSMTTAHANSPRDALLRLETMVLMAGFDLPLRAIREQIASALDMIVFQARLPGGKRGLTYITEVCGTEDGTILTQDLFVRSARDGQFQYGGRPPRFIERLPDEARRDLQQIFNSQGASDAIS